MNAQSKRAQWIGAACLAAVLALVLAREPWARAGEPPGAATPDAPQCGGNRGSVDTQVQQLMAGEMEGLRAEQGQAGQDDSSGWVVLNNRGYNYGPAAGPQFDALFGDALANPNGDAR